MISQQDEGFVLQCLDNILNEALSRDRNQFRFIAADIIDRDQNFYRDLVDQLFLELTVLDSSRRIDVRNDNDIIDFTNDFFTSFIPWVIYTVNNVPMSQQERADIEHDARMHINRVNSAKRTIQDLQRNQQRGYSGYQDDYSRGSRFGVGQGMGGRFNHPNQSRFGFQNNWNQSNRQPFQQPYQQQYQQPFQNSSSRGSRSSIEASGMISNGNPQQTVNQPSAFEYGAGMRANTYIRSGDDIKPIEEVNNVPDDYNPRDTSRLFDDVKQLDNIPPRVREVPKSSITGGYGTIDIKDVSDEDLEMTSLISKRRSRRGDSDDISLFTHGENYKPGFNWIKFRDPESGRVITGKSYHSGDADLRKRVCPDGIFPVEFSQLEPQDNGVYSYRHQYKDKEVLDPVIDVNETVEEFKAYPVLERECVIELDNECRPVQKLYPLEEAKMREMKDHMIPGEKPIEGILSTGISIREEYDKEVREQIKSLTLTEEEMAEQIKVLEAENKQAEDYLAVSAEDEHKENGEYLLIDKESVVNETLALKQEVSPKSRIFICKTAIGNSSYSKEPRQELLNKIIQCTTFKEVKDRVFNPLINQFGEYVLARKLSKVLDTEFSKVLAKTNLQKYSVSDVIDCFEDFKSIVDDYTYKELQNHVKEMLSTLFNPLLVPKPSNEGEVWSSIDNHYSYLPRQSTVYCIDRTLSELMISDIKTDKEWIKLERVAGNEFSDLCTNVIVRKLLKSKDKHIGQDTYIVTADGVLIEVMPESVYNADSLYFKVSGL